MRWFRFLLIAGLLAAALLALWPQVRSYVPATLAGFRRNHLLNAQDDDVPRLLLELTSLGDDGLPVLVELIGCQRAAVSRPARALLTREVDRWLRMPPAEAGTHMAALAKALAANITDFGPSGREYSEDLVDRLVAATVDGRPLLSASALPDCQYVLQVAAADHRLKWAQRDPNGADAEQFLPPFDDSPEVDESPSSDRRTEVGNRQPAEERVTQRGAAEANAVEPIRVSPNPAGAEAIPPQPLDLETDPLREMPEMPPARPHAEFRSTRLEQPIETKPAPAGGGAARGRRRCSHLRLDAPTAQFGQDHRESRRGEFKRSGLRASPVGIGAKLDLARSGGAGATGRNPAPSAGDRR